MSTPILHDNILSSPLKTRIDLPMLRAGLCYGKDAFLPKSVHPFRSSC